MSDFNNKVREALDAGVITDDGHTLFAPDYYSPYFSTEELSNAHLIRTHKSEGTGKGGIFSPDGSLIEELEAVYNLDFLYWVASEVGVTESVSAIGRGSQAQELVRYISNALTVSA